jgi:hypothetical protein
MKKSLLMFIAIITAVIAAGCAGVVTLRSPNRPKPVKAAGPVKEAAPIKFEDFENGTLVGSYSYANTAAGASAKYMIGDPSKDKAHTGQYCAKAVYNSGTSSDWGAGFACSTSYGAGYIDATGRKSVVFWANVPEGTTFYCFCNEANANGADGEFWNGPDLTGSGKWVEYTVDFEDMHKNIYSGSQTGDNELDPSGLAVVGFQVGGNQGNGTFLVDDIWFK